VDFVDIDPNTLNMSPAALEVKLKAAKVSGSLPKIVVPVHFSGEPCDMRKIHELSKEYGFKIIEDAPDMIAPITLMTVAARAYDLGLKDDAVFWFYAGKNRFLTFARVIDIKDEMFRETESANAAFLQLVGNVVNPYAFCGLAKQRDAAARTRDMPLSRPASEATRTPTGSSEGPQQAPTQRESSPGD